MSWSSRMSKPLVLEDGRILRTLADARAMVLALPEREQTTRRWQMLAGLLLNAAKAGHDGLTGVATSQIERVLSEPPFGSVVLAPAPAEKKPPAPSVRRSPVKQRHTR